MFAIGVKQLKGVDDVDAPPTSLIAPVDGKLSTSLTVRPLLGPGSPSRPLHVRIEGVEVLSTEIAEETVVEFDIDVGLLGNWIPIEFETDDPVSPTELCVKDDRFLSVFVGSFWFGRAPK